MLSHLSQQGCCSEWDGRERGSTCPALGSAVAALVGAFISHRQLPKVAVKQRQDRLEAQNHDTIILMEGKLVPPLATGPAATGKAPRKPWIPLSKSEEAGGYFSFFYADDLSAMPVRAVTKLGDNKSDPNVETGTYGLFSTCSQRMRAAVARQGVPYIFFVTRYRAQRVVVGFFEIGWYAMGPMGKSTADYALAARQVHFLNPPLYGDELPRSVRRAFETRWRLSKRIPAAQANLLVSTLRRLPNRTSDHIREVRRLERYNNFHGGFAYVSWQRRSGFSWRDAASYLKPNLERVPVPPSNSTSSNTWRCAACTGTLRNKALLKRCPLCGELGTLQPSA